MQLFSVKMIAFIAFCVVTRSESLELLQNRVSQFLIHLQ